MTRRLFRTLAALAATMALLAAACGDDDAAGDDEPAATTEASSDSGDSTESGGDLQLDEPVRIALLIPQTGSAAIPEVFEDPMEMAVEEINESGGIGGLPVEYDTYDTGFAPEQGLTALRRALEDDPTVLMGYAITSQVLAAAELLADEELPLIHFSAADETNVSEGGSEWTFRVKLENSSQAAAGARYLMEELGAENLGIMYTNDNYGQTARDAAEALVEDNGGSVVADRSYAFDATDLTEQVLAMSEADAILNWGFPNTIGLQLNQFLQNGVEIPTMDSDSGVLTFSNELAEPEAMEQFYSTVVCNPPGDEREHVQEWTSTFTDRYGYVPESNSAFTWDSVFLYKMAIEEAGGLDGAAIRDALAGTTWDGGVCQQEYESDEDHNLSHDAFITFFGNGEIETVAVYEG